MNRLVPAKWARASAQENAEVIPRLHLPAPGAKLRRRLARAAAAVLALFVVVVAASIVYVLTLPGVGGAQARVDDILALHHGVAAATPPPRKLSTALVDVEDEHFYSNVFVNVLDGAGRAAVAALQTSQDPGGSTIPQQLAKQLYGERGTLAEIGLAIKLSLRYSHTEILSMYLNAVYYGNGYWGDVAAARGYFGKDPQALDWGQAALLAGLPQAPSAYDPLVHYALAKARQRHALDQLVVNHALTEAQADAAYRQPLGLR
ncbi:MAG TPA: biosynthetic peptidoglycan transglycosylase [Solirubrobacteraceae bacterium]|jgi:penicillin-binding protein 1A|nr:biosynthetic peptidoglycan transglycosylase [Solirubrobacteraceae bacterium]